MLTINDLVAGSNPAAPAFDFIWGAVSTLNSIFRAVTTKVGSTNTN